MNYVYIVECRDGTYYTGWTNDLLNRIISHNKGFGAKYTRARYPVVLKYFECCKTRSEAQKREVEIKKLSKLRKSELFKDKVFHL